jgi:hypothetical protein
MAGILSNRNFSIIAIIIVFTSLALLYYFQTSKPRPMYFTVQVIDETFVILITDLETVKLALENLNGKNSKIPHGELSAGDGGFNEPWSWHLVPDTVRMVDSSIEIYDGRPSFVENELEYWLDSLGFYSPWGGKVVSANASPP